MQKSDMSFILVLVDIRSILDGKHAYSNSVDFFYKCKQCNGSGHRECTECADGMVLIENECFACWDFDGFQQTEDGECIEVCGDGIYHNIDHECDDGN